MIHSDELLEKPPHLIRLRMYVEAYYDIQDYRRAMDNRARNPFNLRYELLVREREDRGLAEVLTARKASEMAVRRYERTLEKYIGKVLPEFSIWTSWLKGITGVGPITAGCLIAWLETPKRFETVSKMWAYCGMAVVDGHAPRSAAGEIDRWHHKLRVTCWKLGLGFARSKKGQYRKYLSEAHQAYLKRPDLAKMVDEEQKGAKGHIYAMARRKTVKLFLSHLWQRWRELEELPTKAPYIIGHGHTKYIEPFEK